MRILVVHNTYKEKGGEDNSFALEVNMLRENGNQVETEVFHNSEIKSNLDLLKLPLTLVYNKKSVSKVAEKIKSFKPDIIHVHNFFYVASPGIFYLARQYRIPVVFTVRNFRLICIGAYLLRNGAVCELCVNKFLPYHGILYKCHQNSRLNSFFLTYMLVIHRLIGTWNRKITRYIVLTDFAKEKLLNSTLDLKSNQIVVKPNFIGDNGFISANKRGNYYLFVGRLSAEKGVDVLLNALKTASVRIKIIGDGPLRYKLDEFSNTNLVEYLGFQGNEKIINELKHAKALIFPSIWYEGMPRTILEAFSTGTPVIASDIENIRDIVNDGINGVHFKKGDAQDLAEKLNYFESNSEQIKALNEGAYSTFKEKYTKELNYRLLSSIYSELIES